jgi:hypothetical protein
LAYKIRTRSRALPYTCSSGPPLLTGADHVHEREL